MHNFFSITFIHFFVKMEGNFFQSDTIGKYKVMNNIQWTHIFHITNELVIYVLQNIKVHSTSSYLSF